jgi:N6-adenosine-specific RNA methylase IME4
MEKLQINEKFKNLIPNLSKEEYKGLEESIKKEGCRDKILTWNGYIIDGHNRYEICSKQGIEFKTTEKQFNSENEVKEWIIINQLSRRNLTDIDKFELAQKLEPLIKEKAKKQQGHRTDILAELPKSVNTRKEVSKQVGLKERNYDKLREIKEKTPGRLNDIREGKISINKAYKDIQISKRRKEIKTISKEIPEGEFDVIYADPPWRYEFTNTENRAIENQYPTMDLEEIKNIKIPSSENSILFLWATAPKLKEALEVMESWGYKYKTNAIWDKEIIGMGYYFRVQHEILLIGTKGKIETPIPENRISSIIKEKRTNHSSKPKKVYEIIEKMYPNSKYLELFSRNKRDKWTNWGNENI